MDRLLLLLDFYWTASIEASWLMRCTNHQIWFILFVFLWLHWSAWTPLRKWKRWNAKSEVCTVSWIEIFPRGCLRHLAQGVIALMMLHVIVSERCVYSDLKLFLRCLCSISLFINKVFPKRPEPIVVQQFVPPLRHSGYICFAALIPGYAGFITHWMNGTDGRGPLWMLLAHAVGLKCT
jgi:hypothetical protein